ncbi:hypothetical protein CFC21_066207 [Triticum aestivum]|uniref:Glutathione S-transferase n=2 Tax=Triticum aestivum TaxID=4565 RepID=A0A3B6KI66_WHEAT|nr:hypothetical protein CFC21_066207 [Triticum aestivum]
MVSCKPSRKCGDFLQLTPKKVPVLVHDGKPIAESTVIVEYIDEAWKDGYPIMPADPYDRAQARFWARFADDKCNAAIYPVFTATGEAQREVVREAQRCLKTLEKALVGKKFWGRRRRLPRRRAWVVRALAADHRGGLRRQRGHRRGAASDEGLVRPVPGRRRGEGDPAAEGQAPGAQQGSP